VKTIDSTVGNSMKLIDQMQGILRANNIGLQEHAATLTDADLANSITDLNLTNQLLYR
jgi:hypothetical protein